MEIEQIYQKFPTFDECSMFLEKVRWKGKPICPYCGSKRATPIHNEHRYHCNRCHTSFSVTTGTLFHRTHLPLQKWFLAIKLLIGERQNLSARRLSKALEVDKNTAWLVITRIDRAMRKAEQRDFLQAIVNS